MVLTICFSKSTLYSPVAVVISITAPFQVVYVVIGFNFIFMVNAGIIIGVRQECFSNKSMHMYILYI